MTPDGYWSIIERARAGVPDTVRDPDAVAEAAVALVAALPVQEILDFHVSQEEILGQGMRELLVQACAVVNDYVSDDSFVDFRCWILAQGRRAWEAAVADPDSLADVVGPDAPRSLWCEPVDHIAVEAFTVAAGHDGEDFWDALDGFEPEPWPGPVPPEPPQDDLPDVAAVRAALPRLTALYGWTGGAGPA